MTFPTRVLPHLTKRNDGFRPSVNTHHIGQPHVTTGPARVATFTASSLSFVAHTGASRPRRRRDHLCQTVEYNDLIYYSSPEGSSSSPEASSIEKNIKSAVPTIAFSSTSAASQGRQVLLGTYCISRYPDSHI